MAPSEVSGAVLAGGRGRRMGRPKADLLVAGEPLLRRQLRVLRAAGVAERLVSLAAEGEPGVSLDDDVRVVRDARSDGGPLAGLERVLAVAQHDCVLVLAVDLPAMDAGFLRELVAGCRSGRGVVPMLNGRYEPLAAVYPRRAQLEAAARLARDELALQDFVAAGVDVGWLLPRMVTAAEVPWFLNWNHPDDFPMA